MRDEWRGARRIVIKIGSALLADRETGSLKSDWLDALCDDVAALRADGRDIVVVSSGAIALGRRVLRLPSGPLKLEESQAAAAVGQIALSSAWREVFARRQVTAAQVLLTLGDTEERRRYLNARNTLAALMSLGVVAVVNENDTVATSEIRYGDNDRLAARVGSMISADCVVLLSDIDGLYTAPPAIDSAARRLDVVEDITPEIKAMAGDAGSELSRGGMVTKIAAAEIAVEAGAHLIIANGKISHPLRALSEDAPSTIFLASANPVVSRKRWIAGSLVPKGTVIIDDGARTALESGRSLLPAGVVQVEGSFDRGDAVSIAGRQGEEIGRGLIAYSIADAARLIGCKTAEIETILGYRGRSAMIHRDDMVLKRSM
ncbi:MAG: glutamate 5-kinase [Hyphomicrobiales bacterium]|nr:glutamate 5-kinase [Hyphomicrobiales bacterium]